MMDKPRTLFITGATGTLGREFICEILKTTSDKIYILARRKGTQSHWDRVRNILDEKDLAVYLGTRVHVCEGDVSLPSLGLADQDRLRLKREVTHFFHIAALTTLNASEADCRSINTQGTGQALSMAWEFFREGTLRRFYYFSTAYVSGSLQTYCAKEDELTQEPAFANFYESSKYAAEKQVREAMKAGLPSTIFRPSIVVGHSETGEVGEFNVIYPFMKLFAHGILKKLPTHPENSFNLVPIDFVTRASIYISGLEESVGKTYHLVSREPPTIGMLLKVKENEYPQMPPVEIIDPDGFDKSHLDPMEQYVFQMLEPYLGYLNDHLTFEVTNTLADLAGSGIEFPKTDYDFLHRICDYAIGQGYLVTQ